MNKEIEVTHIVPVIDDLTFYDKFGIIRRHWKLLLCEVDNPFDSVVESESRVLPVLLEESDPIGMAV